MSTAAQLDEWSSHHIQGAVDGSPRHVPLTWLGTFMSDELERATAAIHSSSGAVLCGIFNIQRTGEQGDHWVGFRIQRPGCGLPAGAVWFDSYGLKRPDEDAQILRDRRTRFGSWLRSVSGTGSVTVSALDLQALDTAVCGQYALWFCKHGLPTRESAPWAPLFRVAPVLSFGATTRSAKNEADARRRDEIIGRLVKLPHPLSMLKGV